MVDLYFIYSDLEVTISKVFFFFHMQVTSQFQDSRYKYETIFREINDNNITLDKDSKRLSEENRADF